MDELPIKTTPDASTTPEAIDWRSLLIATFALAPAEGAESVTDEQIQAAFDTATAAGGEAGTQVADLQSRLDETIAALEMKTGELDGINAERADGEVSTILAEYADRITDEGARTAFADLLKTNRDAGMAILNGLPAAAAAAPEKETAPEKQPPAPMHAPGKDADAAPDQSAKLDEQNALVEAIRKETRGEALVYPDYDSARNEARRRQPELFA